MRIEKAKLVSPGFNDAYAIFAIAVTMFVFAYTIQFGQKGILIFYALWLPLALIDPGLLLSEPKKILLLLVFPLFACLSTFWSDEPSATLRAGLQYTSLAICALIAARAVSGAALARGIATGAIFVLAYSMAFGTYSYDAFDQSFSFVGAFASKNQLGFYASLGILFGLGALILAKPGRYLSVLWLGVIALSAYLLIAAHSATSLLSISAVVLAIAGILLIFLFPSRDRRLIFGFGLFVLIVVAVFGFSGAAEGILGLVGKDTTLTGRTYLWSEGFRESHNAPIVGMGYQAFWTQGFPHAEQLWAEFSIGERFGFHFHNTYIETLVGLGYVGVVLLALLVATVVLGNFARLLSFDGSRERLLLAGVSLLLLIRSFFEIDFLTPYTIGGFLLYYAAGNLLMSPWPSSRMAGSDDRLVSPAYPTSERAADRL